MVELVREEIPLAAFDVQGDRRLRVFFLLPAAYVADVELVQDGDVVGVALYRRVYRGTEPGDDEVDGAYLSPGAVAIDLDAPLGGRAVVGLGSGVAVPPVAVAGKRKPFGSTLLEVAAEDAPRWRFVGEGPRPDDPPVTVAPPPDAGPGAAFPPGTARELVAAFAEWLDTVVPAAVRVTSDGAHGLRLRVEGPPERRATVDLSVLAGVGTWGEAAEQLEYLLPDVEEAVAEITGQGFPPFPASPVWEAGWASSFVELGDDGVTCGWRRTDGWQLAMDPWRPEDERED